MCVLDYVAADILKVRESSGADTFSITIQPEDIFQNTHVYAGRGQARGAGPSIFSQGAEHPQSLSKVPKIAL